MTARDDGDNLAEPTKTNQEREGLRHHETEVSGHPLSTSIGYKESRLE